MDKILRLPTKSTPYIHMDADTDTYIIAGRSIPLDAELCYRPVLNWLDLLGNEKPRRIVFCIRLDFFNIASSKRILFVLYKLIELRAKGFVVTVIWMTDKYDDDMREIGVDYATMLEELEFRFEIYDSKEISESKMIKFG